MASATQHAEVLAAFPYPPYEIQKQLMINVYKALQQKQIGLFESPTGTGKTLSIICSTLKWLEDEHQAQAAASAAAAAKAAEEDAMLPDWMRSFGDSPAAPQQAQSSKQQVAEQRKQRVQVIDDHGNDISEFLVDTGATSAAGTTGSKRTAADFGYHSSSSDGEDAAVAPPDAGSAAAGGPAAAAAAERRRPQLIFCSRTHSQLSQFVRELHRTCYADSVMLVALGSRKNLCVNEEVLRLGELSQINERCLDMQRSKASRSRTAAAAAAAAAATAGATHTPDGTAAAAAGKGVVGLVQQPARQRGRQRQRQRQQKAGCPFLSVEGGSAGWEEFSELVLAAPIDVEELAALGRRKQVCAYYGSRRAVPSADVLLAPYSSVLLPEARQSLGISLADSVVVFDEAHNLLDAINAAHSTAVSAWQLLSVQRSFSAYYERFKAFLNPVNAQNLQLLLRIAAALHACLVQQQPARSSVQQSSSPGSSTAGGAGRVLGVNDLLFDLGLDNINMFELARWVRDNKMAFKVSGYTAVATAPAAGGVQMQQTKDQQQQQKTKEEATKRPNAAAGLVADAEARGSPPPQQQQQQQLGQLSPRDGVSAIHSFVSFLLSLTNTDADGRVIIEQAAAAPAPPLPPSAAAAAAAAAAGSAGEGEPAAAGQASRGGRMRYVLLNAARHFGQLLASARSVLLVSGTLAPVEGLRAQLFPELPAARLRHFECGHVVPAEQLLAVSVGSGPSGKALNLRHELRGGRALMDELGLLLLNLAGVVPEGLVVFAPSFAYLEQLVVCWQSSGLLARLQQRKQLFREPRSGTEVEQVLTAYAAATAGSKHQQQPASQAAAAAAATVPAAASRAVGPSGAVLLCVVGGKLSEGINFGDGLGRCVVVLGMPYPNPSDPELKERMAYMDKQAAAAAAAAAAPHRKAPTLQQQRCEQQPEPPHQQPDQQQQQQQQQQPEAPPQQVSAFHIVNAGRGLAAAANLTSSARHQQPSPAAPTPQVPAAAGAAAAAGSNAVRGQVHHDVQSQQQQQQQQRLLTGRDYYDDLCFKAVNQCVGRVVRHQGDYAAVVLVDTRWVAAPQQWQTALQQQQQQQQQGGRQLPVQKLPGWVQRSYVPTPGEFGQAYKQLAQFFARQRQRELEAL